MSRRNTVEVFWSRVRVGGESECWPWIGRRCDDGYGKITFHGRGVMAHRMSYELRIGPIPHGLVIDHLCRNRSCVNPAHLEPVTIEENIRRGRAGYHSGPRGLFQKRKTHCPRGHAYAETAYVTPSGTRTCKICQVESTRRWRARNAEKGNSNAI